MRLGLGLFIDSNCVSSGFTPLFSGIAKAQTAWFLPAQLWADYTDCCIVRRASDDAEQIITYVDGLPDNDLIASFCGVSLGYLSKADDQSGNGKHWIQATKTKQPLIYDGSSVVLLNGHLAMQSDTATSTQDLLVATITGSATTTAFHVYKTLTNSTCINSSSGSAVYGIASVGQTSNNYGDAGTPTTYVNGSSIGATRGNLYTATFDKQVVNTYINLDLSTWTEYRTTYEADSITAPTLSQGGIIFDTAVSRTDIEAILNDFLSVY